jgi:hypothetical protein
MTDRLGTTQASSLLDVSAEALKAKLAGRVNATGVEGNQAPPPPPALTGEDSAAALATISPEALTKLNAEREAVRFGRTAARITDAGEQPERVQALKAQFEAGQIGDYLSQLDTTALSDSLLKSPVAGFLTRNAA